MSRIAAATSRAFPTSVWMRMYAWTTTRLLSAARARPAVKLPHRKVTTGRPGGIRWSRRGMEGAMTVATTGEFGLIARVTSRLGRESSADSRPDFGGNCLLGPGDDAAVVATPDGRAVLSTDVLVEGRHFRRDWSGARDVGHRAAAANMADIAALAAEASLVGAAVVGGDMSASGTLTIAVTAVGDLGGQAPVVRSGARPGDIVALAGRIGYAAAGYTVLSRGFRSPKVLVEAHRRPEVPYAAGPIAARRGATSMIDVSDGLVADLGHVATASGVGIDLRREAFPVPAQMRDAAAALGVDPYTWILAGGDDFRT